MLYFQYAESEVTVRDCLQDFFTEPFPEFNDPFLVTRWTEMPSLTRKCQEIFMTTVITTNSGETMIKDTAIKVTIDHLSHIGPRKSILLDKTVLVNLLKLFKMVLNALVVRCALGIALLVYRLRHGMSHPWQH